VKPSISLSGKAYKKIGYSVCLQCTTYLEARQIEFQGICQQLYPLFAIKSMQCNIFIALFPASICIVLFAVTLFGEEFSRFCLIDWPFIAVDHGFGEKTGSIRFYVSISVMI